MPKLALNGGEPTRTQSFPDWPIWDEREEKALLETLRSGHWGALTDDSRVARFEEAFALAHHARHGRCVTSGTIALEVALRAVGVEFGDEVIVPPYTFIATASTCLMVGAIPVFVDIDPETYNLDPTKVEAAITARTRVIMPVHIGGCPADMDRIMELAQRHELHVIEDACQAHAAAWDNRRVGAIGDMGCFSFQASKNINAGEGGIILTNQAMLAERAWSIRNCGRIRDGAWYRHEVLGDNYRMTEWQAAVLLAQLTRMEDLARRREANALYLAERLADVDGITPQRRLPKVTQHAYHLFIARYNPEAFDELPRAHFLAALRAEGVPCSEGYGAPLYAMPAIQHGIVRLKRALGREDMSADVHCPVAERACAEEGIWFGQNMFLGAQSDMDNIVAAIRKIQQHVDELQD
jgi:dTDP-4-amino-4,6-dideoxygalactose transaminase